MYSKFTSKNGENYLWDIPISYNFTEKYLYLQKI